MAKSLQEQLLQAGAAKPKQAKKARQEKTRKNQAARQKGQSLTDEQALQREIAAEQATKRERDRQLNAEQKAARDVREVEHAVDQIVSRNRIAADGEVAYSYTIGDKIRRIQVSDKQRRDLAEGRLAIVRHRERASLVPRAVAERLVEKIPAQLWLVTPTQQLHDPDDPYADYQVPDDLMW